MADFVEMDDRIAKCNKILEENPNSQIFAALAEAYRKKGGLDQAFRVCQNGLKVHPRYGSAHMVMARINLDKGMLDWAELEVQKTIELEGSSYASDLLLADIYVNKGELAKATKILNKLQKVDPNNKQIIKLIELSKKLSMKAPHHLEPPPEPAVQEIPDQDILIEEPAKKEIDEMPSIKKILDILAEIIGVEGVLLINQEGLVAESRWPEDSRPDLFGALVTDIERTVQSQLDSVNFGEYESVLIETDDLLIYMLSFRNNLLLIKGNRRINLGGLKLKLQSLLEKLESDL